MTAEPTNAGTSEVLRVADLMHRGIVSCTRSTTAREIAQLMVSDDVHCVAVLSPSPEPGHPPVRTEDGPLSGQDQDGLRPTVDDLEDCLNKHRWTYPWKYSRPSAASASGVGLRWTTTRQPACPWAI